MSKVENPKKAGGNVEPLPAGSPLIPKLLHKLLIHASPTGKEKVISDIVKATILSYNKDHVIVEDKVGNLSVEIGKRGEDHNTLFSCHMDTVHFKEEILSLGISKKNFDKGDGFVFAFTRGKLGGWIPEVLGADDKLGIYALLRLIKQKTPGLYIFHTGEERGGIGSRWIVDNNPGLVKDIKRAIAFDRRGTTDVIGEQRGSVCCSSDFGIALAARLNQFMPPKNLYKSGAIGSFTDTASYTKLIPECTNISCGYYNEHSASEHFDLYWYTDSFLPAILKMNWETLPTVRDPTVVPSRVTWHNSNTQIFSATWRLDLDNVLKCKDERELNDHLKKWLDTIMIADGAKEFQLKMFVRDVLKKLDKVVAPPPVETTTLNKELLNSYVALLKNYIGNLGIDLAATPDKNAISEDKIGAVYAHYDLITKLIAEHETAEEDEDKPKLEELLTVCVDFMFICVQVAGELKVKSSGMIDATEDIIKALVNIRQHTSLKGTTFRKTVKLPAVETRGKFQSMPAPCVKKCNNNDVYGICTGCNRTPNEKKEWYVFSLDKQKDIWNSCILRGMAFPEINTDSSKPVN